MEEPTPEPKKQKGLLQEKVHELYFKMFPGSDCPVTGSAREKLLEAAARSQERREAEEAERKEEAATEKEEKEWEKKKPYKHPHVYDVYGRRIDGQQQQQQQQGRGDDGDDGVWKMPSFLYRPSIVRSIADLDRSIEESRSRRIRGRSGSGVDAESGSDGSDGGKGMEGNRINPANRMPMRAEQDPMPGQKEELSTSRQRSSIPKAGTDDTWLYPSPQMFYNSLVRKKKADDVSEKDMDAVVATHNTVNEATWSQLLQWERLYAEMYPEEASEEPRLLRFRGRPHDLSPKALLKKLLGYGAPFDRHDWTVDRGGREMRYVIDFYYDEDRQGWPFLVDVRPALDSPTALLLRARMMLRRLAHPPSAAAVAHVDKPSTNADPVSSS